mmetsp:Transcript_34503/g.89957  ORF Transcript_34503/g.89957 Transcript_34503/m.89957 type:complete len:136 (+) Transcript_34503:243-650(+)
MGGAGRIADCSGRGACGVSDPIVPVLVWRNVDVGDMFRGGCATMRHRRDDGGGGDVLLKTTLRTGAWIPGLGPAPDLDPMELAAAFGSFPTLESVRFKGTGRGEEKTAALSRAALMAPAVLTSATCRGIRAGDCV